MKQTFEKIQINNQEALLTTNRLDRNNLPAGYYAYDIRSGDDDGEPKTIESHVMVNHFGTILTTEQIPMTKEDYTPICEFGYLGEEQEIEL